MAAPVTNRQAEVANLQTDTSSAASLISLHDLRELYYKNQLGITGANRQETELIRSWLQGKLGITNIQSLYDLWKLYLVAQGVTLRLSLQDMFTDFFGGTGEPPITNTAGTMMGFPFAVTYSS